MSKSRTFVVVGFNVVDMRWAPMFRCETLARARHVFEPIAGVLAGFVDIYSISCDIEDVEAIEAMCAGLPPVALYDVFSAYADIADHAFTLGGSKWFRVPPGVAKRTKGGTVH